MENKIAEFRKKKKHTQQELAEALKINRTHLSQVETGKVNPSIALLGRIAEKLGVSIKDFF